MKNISHIFLMFYFSLSSLCAANPYDQCKEILRDGVRDTLATNDSVDNQLASHNQFCSIAKSKDLNEQNFNAFAKDYSKALSSSENTYGGGLNVGIKQLGIGANYGQGNGSSSLSQTEKENLLKANKQKIIEYFDQNCGQASYEESLKSEAVLMSKIANPDIVAAWRDCMLNMTGFFVDLVPSTHNQEEDEIEYGVILSYNSNDRNSITSVVLLYRDDLIETPYEAIKQNGRYSETVDLCVNKDFTISNGESYHLRITHKDRTKSANISVIAKTNTKAVKSHELILPKRVVPEPIVLEPNEADLAYWMVENYCNNTDCNHYRTNISSVRHEISEEYLVTKNQLNFGTCENCNQTKDVRFGFRNCRYKLRGKTPRGDVAEKPEDFAHSNVRYIYPLSGGTSSSGGCCFSKIRIITGPLDGPSIERDEI